MCVGARRFMCKLVVFHDCCGVVFAGGFRYVLLEEFGNI